MHEYGLARLDPGKVAQRIDRGQEGGADRACRLQIDVLGKRADGLGPGDAPRPTGTLVSDSGVQADFVLDEVMIVAPSEADLQPLLDRYDGAVVGRLPLRNEDATSFLVRLDPMTVDPAHLTRDLARTNPDASGDYTVDADASLALLAVVAREARELGASISPNWVPQPQSIASGSTE
ncbi:MAG: hypothetical protein AAF968_26810, partial [Pseudomonadota bacterium]